jgi:hypothetical protein
MIDRAHDLPITKQAAALNISRGSVYYLPRPVSAADLALMRRMRDKTRPSRIPPLGPEVASHVVALTLADPPVALPRRDGRGDRCHAVS